MSEPLRMLRLGLDARLLTAWAVRRRLTRPGDDLGYALHCLTRELFGPLAPKPFHLAERRSGLSLYGYGAATAAALRAQAAAFADPELCAVAPLEDLAVKEMPAGFEPGRRLGFEVRVRPTRRGDRNGDRRQVVETDAFLQEAAAKPGEALERMTVYRVWLGEELARDGAAALLGGRPLAYRRTRLLRPRADRSLAAIEGPDLVFAGQLAVVDAAAFAGLLARGLGRHRAFGFGMLLLRPPEQAPC